MHTKNNKLIKKDVVTGSDILTKTITNQILYHGNGGVNSKEDVHDFDVPQNHKNYEDKQIGPGHDDNDQYNFPTKKIPDELLKSEMVQSDNGKGRNLIEVSGVDTDDELIYRIMNHFEANSEERSQRSINIERSQKNIQTNRRNTMDNGELGKSKGFNNAEPKHVEHKESEEYQDFLGREQCQTNLTESLGLTPNPSNIFAILSIYHKINFTYIQYQRIKQLKKIMNANRYWYKELCRHDDIKKKQDIFLSKNMVLDERIRLFLCLSLKEKIMFLQVYEDEVC